MAEWTELACPSIVKDVQSLCRLNFSMFVKSAVHLDAVLTFKKILEALNPIPWAQVQFFGRGLITFDQFEENTQLVRTCSSPSAYFLTTL